MKYYKYGKDRETLPCIELDDGTVVIEVKVLRALAVALIKKGVITKDEIKAEL